MKPALFAAAALAVGIVIGNILTRQEFTEDEAVATVRLTSSSRDGDSPERARKGPKVTVVNGERHNFGSMDRNEHNSHVFILRNDGDAPLTLLMGQPTCKCTVGALEKDSLAPGETVEVKLEWDAKTSETRFAQAVDFHTNDPSRRTLNLSVVGEVLDAVRAHSSEMFFNDMSRNEPTVGTMPIFAFRDEPLEIENVELTNQEQADYFAVSFEPLSAEELAYEAKATSGLKMIVQLQGGVPVGRIEQTIRLTTNVRPEQPLEIRVVGNVASDILLAGPRVVADRKLVLLGPLVRAEGRKHTMYLVVKGPFRDETKLQIKSVEPQAEFSASLGEPLRDNPRTIRHPLTIEIPPNATPVSRMAEGSEAIITIASTHPDEKELIVKVRYVVKGD
jgi:hypothetical protein